MVGRWRGVGGTPTPLTQSQAGGVVLAAVLARTMRHNNVPKATKPLEELGVIADLVIETVRVPRNVAAAAAVAAAVVVVVVVTMAMAMTMAIAALPTVMMITVATRATGR